MQSGFLTSHDGATDRGLFIRDRLLCQPVAAPDDVDMNLEGLEQLLEDEEDTTLSPREIRARHLADPACSGCHLGIDPLGFPFDGFDDSGIPRDTWDGFPIDLAGEIIGTETIDGPVFGAQELVTKLSTAPEVQDCFVQQVFEFVFGRPPGPDDACVVQAAQDAFRASGGDVRELFVELLSAPAVRNRGGVQ